MANYNKSFSFRNGIQVDDDNFVINVNGLVGIGTSIPTEILDIHGTAKVTGLVTTTNLAVTGVATFYSDVNIGSGITFNPSTGAVNATTFYGSAAGLTGIYAIAVEGWYVNAGNISTTSKVGIGTELPLYALQVGQNPSMGNGFSVDAFTGNINASGIASASSFYGSGDNITSLNASNISNGTLSNSRLPQDINVTGIITASSLSGSGIGITNLNASNISTGTLSDSRLPQNISISGIVTANSGFITSITNTNLNNIGIATLGIVTASQLYVSGVTTSIGGFVGNLTGTASLASNLVGTPNITVGKISSGDINSGITTTTSLNTGDIICSSIGVGTTTPSADIHIRKNFASKLQVTSDTAEAIIAVGRSTTFFENNGALRFGNISGAYPYSTPKSLDIINYDTGNLNYYLHYGNAGVGTGNFNWIYAPSPSNPLMTLSYRGNLGIGTTNPSSALTVTGSGTSTSQLYVVGVTTLTGNVSVSSTLTVSNNIGIGTANPKGILDLVSTTQPLYLPRMTTAQRNAIVGISSGAIIFNTSVNEFQGYTGTNWVTF